LLSGSASPLHKGEKKMAVTSKKQLRTGARTKLKPTPITAPAVEPKRTPDQDENRTRDERWAAMLDTNTFAQLDRERRAELAVCQHILEREHGCTTPFEEFFSTLITWVSLNSWPTPDRVAQDLETFKQNFEDMERDARLFVGSYYREVEIEEIDAA
jgi:hypothetical protein